MVPCQCHGNREKEKQNQAQVHVSSQNDTNAERKTSSKLGLFSVSFERNCAFACLLLVQKRALYVVLLKEILSRVKPLDRAVANF